MLDPLDFGHPILKISFKKCLRIGPWTSPLMSPIKGEVLSIVATEYVRMRGDNLIRPYEFVKSPTPIEFRFEPNYISLREVLSKICRLHDAWKLPPRQITPAIEAICDEAQRGIVFNTAWLEELSERILQETVAAMVLPLVSNRGRVLLTNKRIYFQPFNNVETEPVKKFKLRDVSRVVPRRYMLRDVGIELFLQGNHSLYLSFASPDLRNAFYEALMSQQAEMQLVCEDQVNVMLSWQCGALSTFDYLMYLNSMADRSFNDLAQYPVMPWVLADYTSPTLDLTRPATFRDLSKPIGALNEDRLASFHTRYRDMPDPKFLYGSHYSTPGYVLFYTIRAAPEYSLCLQNGRFDHADRLFTSIPETWANVLTGAADVKELTPEFYMPSGEFLDNALGLDLGTCQDGTKVGNVALPPWARSSADFTAKCREALESEWVSANIHQWIDLIFGYKQTGPESVKANNVFYYLTYEGAVDLEKIQDPCERQALETQILEFGQTPRQLFTLPHPQRRVGTVPVSFDPAPSAPSPAPSVSTGPSRMASVSVPTTPAPEPLSRLASLSLDSASSAPTPVPAPTPAPAPQPYGWACLSGLVFQRANKTHRKGITALSVDGASGTLYTVGQDSCLKLHALADDRQLHSVQIGDLALSSCIPVGDAKSVVVGSWDDSIYIYSLEFGRVVDSWPGHDDAVSNVCLFEDYLLTSSWDSSIKVWRFGRAGRGRGGDLVHELNEHDGEVSALVVHAESRRFASGGKDGKIVIWSLDTFSRLFVFDAHRDGVLGLSFSTDGRRLASCGSDAFVRVFDVELCKAVCSSDALGFLHCIAFNGQFVVGGSAEGELVVWDLVGSQAIFREARHTGPIRCLSVSPDGRSVVTGGEDRSYAVWST